MVNLYLDNWYFVGIIFVLWGGRARMSLTEARSGSTDKPDSLAPVEILPILGEGRLPSCRRPVPHSLRQNDTSRI